MMIDFPPAIHTCVAEASQRYEIPHALLYSVIKVEGGKAGTISKNRNGTADLGWAQINTVWLPTLKKYGISKQDLLYDPCVNIGISAWILRKNYARYYNWVDAISAYNSGYKLKYGRKYARKVIVMWRKLNNKYKMKNYTYSMNP